MSKKITRRQIIDINRAQKSIHMNTIKMNYKDVIRFDLNTVFDQDNSFLPSVHDAGQIVFTTLFGTTKNVIYKHIVDNMFKAFVADRLMSDKSIEYNYCLKLIKKIRFFFTKILNENDSVKLNMNRIMYVMFCEREYIYSYIYNVFREMYNYITDHYIIEKYIKNDLFSDSVMYIESVYKNIELIQSICNKIIDKIIIDKILFHDQIPENIINIIKYINKNIVEKSTNGDNEGQLIERNMFKCFNTHEHKRTFDHVFKQNVYVLNDHNKFVAQVGKKGEFDIVIGSKDKGGNIFKIRSVYDIKRSAKLIPTDIDKFSLILKEKDLKLKIESQSHIQTKKFKSFTKGYIYIYDFDIPTETSYKFRDILVEYIIKNYRSKKFFLFMCSQLFLNESTILVKFNKKFKQLFEQKINTYNEELYDKMKDFDIRKFKM